MISIGEQWRENISSMYVTKCQIKKDLKLFGGPLYLIKKSSEVSNPKTKEGKKEYFHQFILFYSILLCKNIVFFLTVKILP